MNGIKNQIGTKLASVDLQKITKRAVFLIIAVGFLLTAREVSAQQVSLGIFPPIMQIETTPPAEVKSKFYLQNEGDGILNLNIEIKAFKPSKSNDGQIEILETTENFPDPLLINRVKIKDKGVAIKSLTLSPKQRKELDFEIIIPPNEAKGDYYFTLFFVNVPSTNISTNSTLTSAGVAMNVLLSVGPKGETKGFIDKFSTPLFVDSGPVPFTVQVENQSDHFVSAKGSIIIENIFGQKVGKIDLLPVNILSGSQRLIPDSKNSDLNAKIYPYPVAIWPEKFLIGPYKATLTLGFSDTDYKFSRKISFFAFPATYLIAILLVLGVITFIILRIRKKID